MWWRFRYGFSRSLSRSQISRKVAKRVRLTSASLRLCVRQNRDLLSLTRQKGARRSIPSAQDPETARHLKSNRCIQSQLGAPRCVRQGLLTAAGWASVGDLAQLS